MQEEVTYSAVETRPIRYDLSSVHRLAQLHQFFVYFFPELLYLFP